ncbi:sensor histidine kinase [Nakamurella endophytica]|uniref:sensor histidine kinase n=1 Tax=Nakamurella endophytica TaxID=1748367 RepID=UPI00166C2A36|nr:histidine kinase [Nakamurella endophytica]
MTIAAKVALSAPRLSGAAASVAITWLVVSAFAVTGLALLSTGLPSAAGWGCLWVALGTLPGDLNNDVYASAGLTPLGFVLEPVYLPLAVALVLRYPSARLTAGGRRMVVVLAVWAVATRLLAAGTTGLRPDGFRRPPHWPSVRSPFWHDVVAVDLGRGGTAALLVVAATAIVVRVVHAPGLTRRAALPLASVGVGCAAAAAVDQAVWALGLAGPGLAAPALVRDLLAATLPVTLLADLLRRRIAAAAVSEQVLAAAAGADLARLQTTLRSVLVDPALTVASPAAGTGAAAAERRRCDVRQDDGTLLLMVDVDRRLAEDPVLDTALHAVRVGMENVRLAGELRERVVQLEAAGARIVEATLEERRRIERDLHDGAQQGLLAVAATLARSDLVPLAALPAVVAEARSGLRAALADLRAFARGVHPTVLTQQGLPAAVRSLPVPGDVRLDLRLDDRLTAHRPPPDVESALFFVVAEAVTNSVRHAAAECVRVSLQWDGVVVRAVITDDGTGAVRVVPGGGLAGLTDRIRALGGALDVHADPCPQHDRSGSTVLAELPVPGGEDGSR